MTTSIQEQPVYGNVPSPVSTSTPATISSGNKAVVESVYGDSEAIAASSASPQPSLQPVYHNDEPDEKEPNPKPEIKIEPIATENPSTNATGDYEADSASRREALNATTVEFKLWLSRVSMDPTRSDRTAKFARLCQRDEGFPNEGTLDVYKKHLEDAGAPAGIFKVLLVCWEQCLNDLKINIRMGGAGVAPQKGSSEASAGGAAGSKVEKVVRNNDEESVYDEDEDEDDDDDDEILVPMLPQKSNKRLGIDTNAQQKLARGYRSRNHNEAAEEVISYAAGVPAVIRPTRTASYWSWENIPTSRAEILDILERLEPPPEQDVGAHSALFWLAKIFEALNIDSGLNIKGHHSDPVKATLEDGVELCRLAMALNPAHSMKPPSKSSVAYHKVNNAEKCLSSLRSWGLSAEQVFGKRDLLFDFDSNDLKKIGDRWKDWTPAARVIDTLHHIRRLCRHDPASKIKMPVKPMAVPEVEVMPPAPEYPPAEAGSAFEAGQYSSANRGGATVEETDLHENRATLFANLSFGIDRNLTSNARKKETSVDELEIISFIETSTGTRFDPEKSLFDSLKDGASLCYLMIKIVPGCIRSKSVYDPSKSKKKMLDVMKKRKCLENASMFIEAAHQYGIPDRIKPEDIYDGSGDTHDVLITVLSKIMTKALKGGFEPGRKITATERGAMRYQREREMAPDPRQLEVERWVKSILKKRRLDRGGLLGELKSCKILCDFMNKVFDLRENRKKEGIKKVKYSDKSSEYLTGDAARYKSVSNILNMASSLGVLAPELPTVEDMINGLTLSQMLDLLGGLKWCSSPENTSKVETRRANSTTNTQNPLSATGIVETPQVVSSTEFDSPSKPTSSGYLSRYNKEGNRVWASAERNQSFQPYHPPTEISFKYGEDNYDAEKARTEAQGTVIERSYILDEPDPSVASPFKPHTLKKIADREGLTRKQQELVETETLLREQDNKRIQAHRELEKMKEARAADVERLKQEALEKKRQADDVIRNTIIAQKAAEQSAVQSVVQETAEQAAAELLDKDEIENETTPQQEVYGSSGIVSTNTADDNKAVYGDSGIIEKKDKDVVEPAPENSPTEAQDKADVAVDPADPVDSVPDTTNNSSTIKMSKEEMDIKAQLAAMQAQMDALDDTDSSSDEE